MTNIGAPYLSTKFVVSPDHEEDFVRAWQALTGWAMGEGALTGASLIQSETEPQVFRGISYWPDTEARERAFSDPAILDMVLTIGSYCSEIESSPYRLRATGIGSVY